VAVAEHVHRFVKSHSACMSRNQDSHNVKLKCQIFCATPFIYASLIIPRSVNSFTCALSASSAPQR
jgi:hypothetical protein